MVVAESYFALQFHYQVSKERVLVGLSEFFKSGEIQPMGVAGEVLKISGLATANPGFVNRLIQQEYLTRVNEIATF